MTTFGKIYVGNLGTDFQIACQTTDVTGTTNTATDLSTSTAISITLTDPNNNVISYTASALNPPGTDGIAHFLTSTVTSIWITAGWWTGRCTVTFNDGSKASTQDLSFQVLP